MTALSIAFPYVADRFGGSTASSLLLAQALKEAGVGARASALVSGRSEWHARLEERLA